MAISEKQALVIGNDAYVINTLESCVSDATDLSNSLHSIGFRVKCAKDLRFSSMQSTTRHFVQSIRPGSIVLFYFSGHGLQYDGYNYLIPTNDNVIQPNNIKTSAFNLQDLITEMHKKNPKLILCIVDCCRSYCAVESNKKKLLLNGSSAELRTGLAPMQVPTSTIIAYACAAETTASADSRNGRNSMYTYHLLRHIRTANIDIETVLKNVAIDVQRDTKNQQIPFRYSSCNENIYLVLNPMVNVPLWPVGIQPIPVCRPLMKQRGKEYGRRNSDPQINIVRHRWNNQFEMPNNNNGVALSSAMRHGFLWVKPLHNRWQ